MTDLMSRPTGRVESDEAVRRPRSLLLAAALGGLVAAGVGLAVCVAGSLAAWYATTDGSLTTGSLISSARVGVLAWLVGNGGGLQVSSGLVTVVPLGACLAAGWLLSRGGRWAGAHCPTSSLRDVGWAAMVMGLVYMLVGLVSWAVTRGADASADLVRTALITASLGAVCGGGGVLRASGRAPSLAARVPVEVRAAVTGAAAGMAAMVVAAGALLTASLIVHFPTAVTLTEGLQAGVVGGAVVVAIGAAFVPNAVLCAGAFLAGPGFALGTGTAVSPDGISLGPLPTFPLLAAVPRTTGAWWLEAMVAVPVLAGMVAGITATHRFPTGSGYRVALRGLVAALLGGLLFGAATWLATGAVGPGRMAEIGPVAGATLLVCAAGGSVGGLAGAAAQHWVGRRHRLPPTPRD